MTDGSQAGTAMPEPEEAQGRTFGGDEAEAAVTRTVARLDGLGERPLAEHVAVFEEVLGELESTLASVDGSA